MAIFRAAVHHNIMANRFDGCEKTNICAYGALMDVFISSFSQCYRLFT